MMCINIGIGMTVFVTISVEEIWECIMHICMSYMDFEEYIGFDVKNTFSTEETDYNYQCLKCHKTDEAKNNMQSHIKVKHKLNKVTKCNLCMYEATSFTGLKKHFRSKHVKS